MDERTTQQLHHAIAKARDIEHFLIGFSLGKFETQPAPVKAYMCALLLTLKNDICDSLKWLFDNIPVIRSRSNPPADILRWLDFADVMAQDCNSPMSQHWTTIDTYYRDLEPSTKQFILQKLEQAKAATGAARVAEGAAEAE